MARKTIDLERLRDMANAALRDSVDDYREQRDGIAFLLERALHESGRYRGFSYIGGYRPNDPAFDETRRTYH